MGLGIVPDTSQPPGSTPPHFDQIGSRNFPFFYNGLPTEQGYALTYNHQRGAVPNHLGWRTRPLHIYPLTGVGITDEQLDYQHSQTPSGPTAEQYAHSLAESAARLVRVYRRLHNSRAGGVEPPKHMVDAYVDAKLRLTNELSQICREKPGVRIPMPKELNLFVRDAASQSCITPLDIPMAVVEQRAAGLGLPVVALLAIPGVPQLIGWLVAGLIVAVVGVVIAPMMWAKAEELRVTTTRLDEMSEACSKLPTPQERATCQAQAGEEYRKNKDKQGDDPWGFEKYLKWGAALVGLAVLGPPIIQAISKATSKT